MPQMMPINWILSFFLFIMIFIIFNIMNFYCMTYNKNNENSFKMSTKNNLIWKW